MHAIYGRMSYWSRLAVHVLKLFECAVYRVLFNVRDRH